MFRGNCHPGGVLLHHCWRAPEPGSAAPCSTVSPVRGLALVSCFLGLLSLFLACPCSDSMLKADWRLDFFLLVCLLSHGRHLEQLSSSVMWPVTFHMSCLMPVKVQSTAEARVSAEPSGDLASERGLIRHSRALILLIRGRCSVHFFMSWDATAFRSA